jgi:hypothetical protein
MTTTKPNKAGLKKDLTAFLKAHNFDNTKMYTQAEWQLRGERWLNDSPFVLTTEDALYDDLNYGEYGYSFYNELTELANKNGYYFELGFSWCLGFYPSY